MPRLALMNAFVFGLVSVALILSGCLADFVVKDGSVAVLDPSGITSQSSKFSTANLPSASAPLVLSEESTLKITFDVVEKESGKGTIPQQISILASGADTNLFWTGVVKARSSGKAKWEIAISRAPTDFLSLTQTGQVLLELVLGDPAPQHSPVRFRLATLQLPKPLLLEYPYWATADGKPPSSLGYEKYYPQPTLSWSFQPPRKPINPITSIAFTGIALSPWVVLLLTWSKISKSSSPSFTLLSSPSASTVLFVTTLISQEILITTYWAKLKLFQYLPMAFFLSLPLILSGRTALSELRARRKKNPLQASHVNVSKLLANATKEKGE